MLLWYMPALSRRQRNAAIYRLGRPCRTHADLPLLMLRAEGFSRQIQTANGRTDFAFAKTFQRAYRNE